MGNEDRISGKVAEILDSRQLVINIGRNDGVEEGMFFKILDPKGEDIKDPETGEVIGSIGRPKLKVKIKEAKEELSIATTYKKKKVNIGGSGVGLDVGKFGKALTPPKWVEKYETLKAEEKAWEDIDEEESFINIGDPVVQLTEEEVRQEQEKEQ